MLKFFRRIRKDLISNGKTNIYFKYAIGEIALVMIGILLALQVSNWNELRKERQLEKRYLSELILETYNNYTIHINEHQAIYDRQQGETWKLLFSTVPNLYTGGDIDSYNQTDVKAALESFEVKNRLYGNYVSGFNNALHQLQIWNKDLLRATREESKKLNP